MTPSVPEWTRRKQEEGPVPGEFKTEVQPVENFETLMPCGLNE
jgi:hypothetical protein